MPCALRRTCLVSLPLTVVLVSASAARAQALADRRIEARPDGLNYALSHPLARSSALAHDAAFLAAGARVPIGVEYVADRFAYTYPAPGISPRPIPAVGRTVREVLDALVALDPRYGWSETDGVIVIRPKGPQAEDPNALLQQRLRGIGLQDAGVDEILAMYLNGFRASQNPPRKTAPRNDPWWEKTVSLRLASPTVLDLLNAFVKAHGDAIWVLSYFAPPATYDHSRLEFIQAGGRLGLGYESQPWPTIPPQPVPLPSPLRVARPLSVAGAIGEAQVIATANRIPTGAELPLGGTGDRPPAGGRFLDLTGLAPDAAFDTLHGEQPGFEWTKNGTVVRMYPAFSRPGSGGPLDRVVSRFELKRTSLKQAHNDVAGLLDPSRRGIQIPKQTAPPRMVLFAETLPVLSTLFDEPRISVSLKSATIRDILDAIVAAHGEAGWTVRYEQVPGRDRWTMSIVMRTFDNTSTSIIVGSVERK